MSSIRTVFVCGATGTQGGALARQLIPKGVAVHTMTRDPSSAAAREIESLGVKLFRGSFDEEDVIKGAVQGVDAIFLNFMPDLSNPQGDVRRARSIMRLGREAGARHVVYSSGAGTDRLQALLLDQPGAERSLRIAGGFFNAKVDVENAVASAGFDTWAVVRPAFFMSNFVLPKVAMYPGLAETGIANTAWRHDTQLPLVDEVTIGVFAAAAVLEPERFHGEKVDIADELRTVDECLAMLGDAAGRDLRLVELTDDEVEARIATNLFTAGEVLTRRLTECLDLDVVRRRGLPLSSFDKFLQREKDAVLATYKNAPPKV
ncbi:hypothetical protein MCOR02_000519 [Pyricularia oryzae]|nr:hypothetical protein MCOR02_000519 [Pyricularia oryzae]KAI6253402.1 hypothetical protein MCOR19_010037 [Pyricularia oryzae]KAI6266102.1 hypothetical protein MCOR26_010384 [Pyricularia oryzae]KAI6312849.1 hypothetical protein MCOR30_010467 [Pyricularia oryzae]KAI6314626.1 hypothetical protein MCOR34_004912 [Pyricularia oryzae]